MSSPPGIIEVLDRFPDEATCRQHVFEVLLDDGRWRCAACEHDLPAGPPDPQGLVRCAACGKPQSLTERTCMEGSRWSLQTWMVAAHLMETQPSLTPLRMAALLKQPPADLVPLVRRVQAALAEDHHRRLLGRPPRGAAEEGHEATEAAPADPTKTDP